MNSLTRFWLPARCVLCQKQPAVLCPNCQAQFPISPRTVTRGNRTGLAVSSYEGEAVDLVHAFKRQGVAAITRFMAKPLARAVAERLRELGEVLQAEAKPAQVRLVPVPSRKDSFRRRGFVPAQLLAAAVASQLAASHGVQASVAKLATLNRPVQDQALLSLQGRRANLSGAMSAVVCAPEITALNRRVILIDDVVTTGATIDELHRALAEAGWNPIFFATFSETL